jgi:hypothetical protein
VDPLPQPTHTVDVKKGDSKDLVRAIPRSAVEQSSDAEGESGLILRGAAFVAVVQATELRNRYNVAVARRRDRPRDGRIFVE